MIEFGGQTIGFPWHGLYRQSDNKVLLPSGALRSWTGPAAPTVYYYGSHACGDVYRVEIPGLPDVVTSPAETSAGMQWRKWAVMSGSEHSLYGVELGAHAWIYIDGAGTPWLSEMTYNLATDAGAISLTRFGKVGVTVSTAAQTLAVSGLFGSSGASAWMIDDIKPGRGERVLLTAYLDVTEMAVGGWVEYRDNRVFKAGREVIITGVPPAATLSYGLTVPPGGGSGAAEGVSTSSITGMFKHHVLGAPGESWIDDIPEVISPYIYTSVMSSVVVNETTGVVIGLAYAADGSAVPVTLSCELTTSSTGDGGSQVDFGGDGWGFGWTLDSTMTGSVTLALGAVSVVIDGSGTKSTIAAHDPYVVTGIQTSTYTGEWRDVSGAFAFHLELAPWRSGGSLYDQTIISRRYANGVYGLIDAPRLSTPMDGFDTHAHRIGLVTPWGSNASIVDIGTAGTKTPWQDWASVNPLDHAVSFSTTGIVYV